MYYVDKRIGEIVKNLDICWISPELYYEYLESDSELFTEKWYTERGKVVSYVYSRKETEDGNIPNDRIAFFESYVSEPLYLISLSVPKDIFKESVNYFYPEEELK